MVLIRYFFILVFFGAYSTSVFAEEKLVFALDLIRHGDRTPIRAIPNSPAFQWQQGPGELTALGMEQEYQLGEQHRKDYITNTHLLPENYQSEMMYVRSTDFDRTLMSAESFLMGLYPLGTGPSLSTTHQPALPNAFQPIPIHTIPQKDDHVFIPNQDKIKLKSLMHRFVLNSPDWKKENARLQPKYAAWSQALGEKITNLEQLITIGDTLFINELHGAPQPPALSKEDTQEIISAGKWAFTRVFKTKEIGYLLGKPLVSVIFNYLQDSLKTNAKLKYVLLSAHDVTILSVMSALGAPLDLPPHYASDVSFLIYEVEPTKYIVKISYNGDLVSLPVCGGATCQLKDLKKLS